MVISVNNFQHLVDGASYTVPGTSANSRLVVIVPVHRSTQDVLFDNVILGAQNATALVSTERTASLGIDMMTGVWYIKEADIPSGPQVVNIVATDNEGSGLGDDIAARVTFSIFTLYEFDQTSTPYFEDPPVEITDGSVGNQLISNSYGSNSGKFAIGAAHTSGNLSDTYTITSNLGDLVSEGDTVGLSTIYSGIHVAYRFVKIDALASNSEATQFTIDFPGSGSDGNGAILNIAYALVFDEASAAPTLTIDQSTLEPGGTISGSYTNFTAGTPPTSPITLTDSGGNKITVAVTITPADPDDGTGTFTGTVQTLPAAGNSGSFLLFGNVTATLDDA